MANNQVTSEKGPVDERCQIRVYKFSGFSRASADETNKQGVVFGLRETGSVIGPPLMAISNFDMQ
jgi:hypothetical protein